MVYAGSEFMQNMGKVIVQGGSTIGTFTAIGTGIRCQVVLRIKEKRIRAGSWHEAAGRVR
jgi:hypothetical protein